MNFLSDYFFLKVYYSNKLSFYFTDIELVTHPAQNTPKSSSMSINEVENFQYVDNAIDFFESNEATTLLKDFNKIILIKMQIKDSSNIPNLIQMNQLEHKCENHSIIIFMATMDWKRFFIFWKSSKIQHFLMLKTYDGYDFMNDIRLFEFIVNFLTISLKHEHLGMVIIF